MDNFQNNGSYIMKLPVNVKRFHSLPSGSKATGKEYNPIVAHRESNCLHFQGSDEIFYNPRQLQLSESLTHHQVNMMGVDWKIQIAKPTLCGDVEIFN
jgi:hypothetical protein